jgi:hypothetical protein
VEDTQPSLSRQVCDADAQGFVNHCKRSICVLFFSVPGYRARTVGLRGQLGDPMRIAVY